MLDQVRSVAGGYVDKNSLGDEIVNVNFFTTILHTYFKIPKKRTYLTVKGVLMSVCFRAQARSGLGLGLTLKGVLMSVCFRARARSGLGLTVIGMLMSVCFRPQARSVLADLHCVIDTLLTILQDDYDITSKQ